MHPDILNMGKSSWSCHFNGLDVVHNAIVFHFTFGFVFGGTMAILWVTKCLFTPL